MGNGNAEENAQDRQAAFKSALTGKHLPVLTLDNKWYRLLNKTGSVPLKETEDALNQLLKRQGKLNTESKDIRNLKKKLMKEIVPMVDEAEQQGENSKLNKQIEDHKRLIEECNEKLEAYEDELKDIPREIERINLQLMMFTMDCWIIFHVKQIDHFCTKNIMHVVVDLLILLFHLLFFDQTFFQFDTDRTHPLRSLFDLFVIILHNIIAAVHSKHHKLKIYSFDLSGDIF